MCQEGRVVDDGHLWALATQDGFGGQTKWTGPVADLESTC